MDSKKHETAGSEDVEKHEGHATEPVIETVARGIGTAMGVVASTAAKVMGKSDSAEPETKPKEKPRKISKPRAAADETGNKNSLSRAAKKKKKRAAHRIKLKRSNTKG
jgi:hypothetical protein